MPENQLELVIDAKATLGEGPCWDNDKQLLYWVDIMGEMYISIIPKLETTGPFM
jgi:sugar lactone lactonase YvrE